MINFNPQILCMYQEQKDSGSEAPAPSAFRDLPVMKNIQNGDMRDVIMGVPTTPEDYEDLRHESWHLFPVFFVVVGKIPWQCRSY